ncbi:MAG: SIS domain-containing protein [Thermoplasmata archaeon]|nr:SIS domain-containing protein [Thermoplasmata archaeon]
MVEFPPPDIPQPPGDRSRHPFWMHEAIRRQEVAVRATLASVREILPSLPKPTPGRPILFSGIGTSFHAALAGSVAASAALGPITPTVAATAFDVLDDPGRFREIPLAVVFSSSGETWITLEATRWLRERGTTVVLVTSAASSRIESIASAVVRTRHADETSWTHTVSFTTAVAAARAMAQQWAGRLEPESDERVLTDAVGAALELEPRAVELAERTASAGRLVLLGSAFAEASAREGALKLREACGRFVATAGVEEFLHGFLPSVNADSTVIALSATSFERERARQALTAAAATGAPGLLIDSSGGPDGPDVVRLAPVPPDAAPIVQVIPFQMLAYWMAVSEGRNPDVMGLDEPRQMAARKTFGI